MVDSAKIYRMEISASRPSSWPRPCSNWSASTSMDACYIRPIVLRGYGEMGVNPLKNPIDVYIACWEWGKYLGEEALAEGVDVCVSSWTPHGAQHAAGAGQGRRQLHELAAHQDGGPGQRLLRGHRAGRRRLCQRRLRREHLRGARRQDPHPAAGRFGAARHHARRHPHAGPRSAAFRWSRPSCRARCCTSPTKSSSPARPPRSRPSARSTASPIGKGRRGPVAEKLQKEFFGIINGAKPDRYGWLSPVDVHAGVHYGGLMPVPAADRL